jgi:thioredoxin 1
MKLLKFYAPWCAPCKGLSVVMAGAEDKINLPIEEVNIDEDIDTALQYGVRSVPTLVIVDDQGNLLKKNVGVLNEAQLLDFLSVDAD